MHNSVTACCACFSLGWWIFTDCCEITSTVSKEKLADAQRGQQLSPSSFTNWNCWVICSLRPALSDPHPYANSEEPCTFTTMNLPPQISGGKAHFPHLHCMLWFTNHLHTFLFLNTLGTSKKTSTTFAEIFHVSFLTKGELGFFEKPEENSIGCLWTEMKCQNKETLPPIWDSF